MRTVFVDSDILLDVILIRFPHYTSSSKVLDMADKPNFVFCTTVHALLNIHYVMKKAIGL